mmetsp:Transcript_106207/g.310476  ORF Transcript_106207/g.310476 Transcript_106207/m.310476 type:complete len:205 (-) Transcript_106207:51-665(-)
MPRHIRRGLCRYHWGDWNLGVLAGGNDVTSYVAWGAVRDCDYPSSEQGITRRLPQHCCPKGQEDRHLPHHGDAHGPARHGTDHGHADSKVVVQRHDVPHSLRCHRRHPDGRDMWLLFSVVRTVARRCENQEDDVQPHCGRLQRHHGAHDSHAPLRLRLAAQEKRAAVPRTLHRDEDLERYPRGKQHFVSGGCLRDRCEGGLGSS